MSIQAMTWVIEHSEARLGARLALIAIANHADRTGNHAFPSFETIALESRLSRRQAINAVRGLEADGHLLVKRGAGPGGVNVYAIVGMAGEKFSLAGGEKSSLPGSEKSDPEVVKNPASALSDFSLEPSLEPSGEPKARTSVPEVHRVLRAYHDGFLGQHGERPHIVRGKDADLVKRLVQSHGVDKVLAALGRFLATTDRFVVENGWRLAVFGLRFNQFLVGEPSMHVVKREGDWEGVRPGRVEP